MNTVFQLYNTLLLLLIGLVGIFFGGGPSQVKEGVVMGRSPFFFLLGDAPSSSDMWQQTCLLFCPGCATFRRFFNDERLLLFFKNWYSTSSS
jgi:hypothetical protein